MEKKRFYGLDVMRTAAIAAVVLIHCLPNESRGWLSPGELTAVNIVHNMFNWAVPVFAMMTGALLIPKKEGFKKCLARNERIFAAIFIFGTLMSFMQRYFETKTAASSFLGALGDVLRGDTWDVMWYLYMLVGLYLFMPVLSTFAVHSSNASIIAALGILFVFNSVFPFANAFFGKVIGFYLPCSSIYVFYALFGYFAFNRIQSPVKKLYPLAALGLCIFVCAAAPLFFGKVPHIRELFAYHAPVVVIMSMAVFLLLNNINHESKLVRLIAENSFGVYLLHCFFIHALNFVLDIYPEDYPLYISVPIIFACVFMASVALSWLLRRIPLVRKKLL